MVATAPLKRYFIDSIRSWVRHARDDRGLDVSEEDVILVTGRDMAANYANVVFVEGNAGSRVKFIVGAPRSHSTQPLPWGSWAHETLNRNTSFQVGPIPANTETENTGPSYDHCVFIRGLRLKKRFLFRPTTAPADGTQIRSPSDSADVASTLPLKNANTTPSPRNQQHFQTRGERGSANQVIYWTRI
jgi:hypothetical protein